MQVTGQNYLVPCLPFDDKAFSLKTETKSAFTTVKKASSMISTTVLFHAKGQDGAEYRPGDVVVVDFEQASGLPWGKKIYPLGDAPKAGEEDKRQRMILIPAQHVLLRGRADGKPEPTRAPGDGQKVTP